MKKINWELFIGFINIFNLFGICVVLALAFIFQFALHELPCPLCLLQRLGLLAIGFGFLLNIRYGSRPLHYGIACLAALYTSSLSMRQILLHIVPGTGSYGLPFLGLHLYTWVFIVSFLIIFSTVILLSFPGQYQTQYNPNTFKRLSHFVFILFILVLSLNIVGCFMECGLKSCTDNPVSYQF